MLEGSEGIRRLGEQAERTGNIVDTNTAEAAAKAVDAMNELRHSVTGLGTQLVGTFAPAVTAVSERLSGFLGFLRDLPGAFDKSSESADEFAESLQHVVNVIRENNQYTITAEEILERVGTELGVITVLYTDHQKAVNDANEALVTQREEMIELARSGLTPAELALQKFLVVQAEVLSDSPALVEGFYAQAAALRTETLAVRAQTIALAAMREERGRLDLMNMGRQTQTRADFQLQTGDFESPSALYDIGEADGFKVAELLREGGFEYDRSVRQWVVPEGEKTRAVTVEAVAEAAGVTVEAIESLEKEERDRVAEQVSALYASNRISGEQFKQLTESTDLVATLNKLTETASVDELRALDSVRSTAFRIGEITRGSSREIVRGIEAMIDRLKDMEKEANKVVKEERDLGKEQREQLNKQLEELYANSRLSLEQYDQLVQSGDLQTTLNSLIADATVKELNALDSVRNAAFRIGEITADGSRNITLGIDAMIAYLKDIEGEQKATTRAVNANETVGGIIGQRAAQVGVQKETISSFRSVVGPDGNITYVPIEYEGFNTADRRVNALLDSSVQNAIDDAAKAAFDSATGTSTGPTVIFNGDVYGDESTLGENVVNALDEYERRNGPRNGTGR